MIQLQNVTKRIKENTVLDNVSYTFKSGFVYGIWLIRLIKRSIREFPCHLDIPPFIFKQDMYVTRE